MKELVEVIIKTLVDNPDAVQVTEVMGNNVIIIEVKVDKSDMGKVIGKQGQTASAIRTLLSATSAKLKRRAVLEILE
ncbi:MAG TPA: KH domain-containing protein [Thermodesulfobacteriota bacterium]|nr:KH domain-containing protein [Thermodesulfobacteriota bacterium]